MIRKLHSSMVIGYMSPETFYPSLLFSPLLLKPFPLKVKRKYTTSISVYTNPYTKSRNLISIKARKKHSDWIIGFNSFVATLRE